MCVCVCVYIYIYMKQKLNKLLHSSLECSFCFSLGLFFFYRIMLVNFPYLLCSRTCLELTNAFIFVLNITLNSFTWVFFFHISFGLWERMRTLFWQKSTDVYDQLIFHIKTIKYKKNSKTNLKTIIRTCNASYWHIYIK